MPGRLIMCICSIAVGTAFGQQNRAAGIATTDSLTNRFNQFIDSLNTVSSLQWLKDSLTINAWADSMQARVTRSFNYPAIGLTNTIDSLNSLNLPTEAHSKKLDSLAQKKNEMLLEVKSRQKDLAAKTKAKLNNWRQKVTTKLKLDSLGVSDKLPEDPNLPLGDLNAGDNLPELPVINSGDFSSLELSPDLAYLNKELPFVSGPQLQGIQDQISGLSSDVGSIRDYLKSPEGNIEQSIAELDGVKELREQLGNSSTLDLNGQLEEDLPIPANADELKMEAGKRTFNHFEGKEENLSKAMEQMMKYKKKFPSKQGLDKIPLLARNSMKSKSLRERLFYGFNLNLQTPRDSVLLNFLPIMGYQISGRLAAGVGGLYQVRFGKTTLKFNQSYPIWGLTSFAYFKTWKNFYLRYEVNTISQPTWNESGNISRAWNWHHYGGIQFNFRITNYIKGSTQYLYNFRYRITDGFPEKSELRIGMEFRLSPKANK